MGKKPAAKSAATAKKTVEKEEKKEVKAAEAAPAKPKKSGHSHDHSVARAEQHCKVKSCKREYRAKGYCTAHYRQWRQGKFGVARYKTCKEHDCRKAMGLNRHGYCEDHYQNYYIKGVEKAKVAAPAPAEKTKEAANA